MWKSCKYERRPDQKVDFSTEKKLTWYTKIITKERSSKSCNDTGKEEITCNFVLIKMSPSCLCSCKSSSSHCQNFLSLIAETPTLYINFSMICLSLTQLLWIYLPNMVYADWQMIDRSREQQRDRIKYNKVYQQHSILSLYKHRVYWFMFWILFQKINK